MRYLKIICLCLLFLCTFSKDTYALCLPYPDIIIGECTQAGCAKSIVVTNNDDQSCLWYIAVRDANDNERLKLKEAFLKDGKGAGVYEFYYKTLPIKREYVLEKTEYADIHEAKKSWQFRVFFGIESIANSLGIPLSFLIVYVYLILTRRFFTIDSADEYEPRSRVSSLIFLSLLCVVFWFFSASGQISFPEFYAGTAYEIYMPIAWRWAIQESPWQLLFFSGICIITGRILYKTIQRQKRRRDIVLMQFTLLCVSIVYEFLTFDGLVFGIGKVPEVNHIFILILFFEAVVKGSVSITKLIIRQRREDKDVDPPL